MPTDFTIADECEAITEVEARQAVIPVAAPIGTAGELRGFLADVLTGIRDGSVGVDKAQAIAKVAAQINQSLICEVNAALQIRKMGETTTGSMLLTSDLPVEEGGGTWCDQCDKRVSKAKLANCTSQFCVKLATAA